jgi:hypothetical protein
MQFTMRSPVTGRMETYLAFGVTVVPGEPRILYDRNGTGHPGCPPDVFWNGLVRMTEYGELLDTPEENISKIEENAAVETIIDSVLSE